MKSLQDRVKGHMPALPVAIGKSLLPFLVAVGLALFIDKVIGPGVGATWTKILLDVGIAVLLGYLDDSFRSADDLERTLNLRAIAAIPTTNGKRLSTSLGATDSELLLEPSDPLPFREAYRQLRTSMLLSSRQTGMKSMLVTSSMPGEGRTTIAVNTALSLARTGALVLIIDADLSVCFAEGKRV